MLRAGNVKQAEKVVWEKCLSEWSAAYQPAGTLWISFPDAGEAEDYRRSLDLEHAAAHTAYRSGGFTFRREAFVSFPDKVIALRFTTDGPQAKAVVALESPHPSRPATEDGVLALRSIAPVYSAPSYFACGDPIRYDPFDENRALSYAAAVLPVVALSLIHI